jgi:histidinol dehydrogenase
MVEPALMMEVAPLLDEVWRRGDAALVAQRQRFDGVCERPLRVSPEEIRQALEALEPDQRETLLAVIDRVRCFARRQMAQLRSFDYCVSPGIITGQRVMPVDSAAVYVPGGRFPLPSSLIMGVVPAQVAGVGRIAVFSPPRYQGGVHPRVLATAALLGIDEVYALGGVAAVAAAAYGSESIRPLDLIVGPGNRYVTAAKKLVYGEIGIDALAGPSEVLVVADDSVDPAWVAADLLAQAEHDPLARAILFCREETVADRVEKALERQLRDLPDGALAGQALADNGLVVVFSDAKEAVRAIDELAPEHLELLVGEPAWWEGRLRHYGTLFIGPWSVEALGDYGAGPNHTLPTSRTARFSAGLSVRHFVKLSTTLRVDETGFADLAPLAMKLAEMEGLDAHRASLQVRSVRSV